MNQNYLLIFILINFLNCKEDEYEILQIDNFPKNDFSEDYPSLNDTQFFLKGNSFEKLKFNAENFYKFYWQKKRNLLIEKNTKNKIDQRIKNIQNDLVIKIVSDKLVIISRTVTGFSTDDLVKVEDVWHLSENLWKPILNHSNSFYKPEFLYLNNDDFIDIIIQGGCCDYVKYSIYLGDKNNNFKHIQNISLSGIEKTKFISKCNHQIKVKSFDELKIFSMKSIYFDCDQNLFKR